MLGRPNRTRHPKHLQSPLQLLKNPPLAIQQLIPIRRLKAKLGIFLMHEAIQFIAERIVVVEGGKSVHLRSPKQKPCQLH
jgi:hypothetical protein